MRVAILVASGFEAAEYMALISIFGQAGLEAYTLSPKKHEVRSWDNTNWAESYVVDVSVLDARAEHYDGLVIPGGVLSADTLRADSHCVRLVRDALDHNLPVAAIGHAPWTLIEAGAVQGRNVTSHPAIRTDLENSGGHWLDHPVAVDGPVITARHRHDLPALVASVLRALGAAGGPAPG